MESKLKDLRVYLSGPCENADGSGGDWRKEITPKLKELGLIVLDPVHTPGQLSFSPSKGEEFNLVKTLREKEEYNLLHKYMKEVVHFDLRMVDSADMIIVRLDADISTTGTIDEIVTACGQKKPVFICSKQGMKTMPLWLFGRIPVEYMFENLDGITNYLKQIASGQVEPDKKRWLFINKFGI